MFAKDDITTHELIEASPVIIFHKSYFEPIFPHLINEYVFKWDSSSDCLCMGYGGIYNHSTNEPNAKWAPNSDNPSMDFYSIRKIAAGEEILIRYVPYNHKEEIWFPDQAADEGAHYDVPNTPLRGLAAGSPHKRSLNNIIDRVMTRTSRKEKK